MVRPLRKHKEYVEYVKEKLKKIAIPIRHSHIPEKLFLLDLQPLKNVLKQLYSKDKGRPAKPPDDMVRSLVTMTFCGVTSIDKWVALMRSFPFYAIISGFEPDSVPGVLSMIS
jgi:hypothetical protein